MSTIKVYLVQRADEHGAVLPEIVAAKLTFEAAHIIARASAPARVTTLLADKTLVMNGPGRQSDPASAQLIAQAAAAE